MKWSNVCFDSIVLSQFDLTCKKSVQLIIYHSSIVEYFICLIPYNHPNMSTISLQILCAAIVTVDWNLF